MTNRPTLPPDDDRDFEQFAGAFDRPVAPAPAFAERLKRQVANAGSTEGASPMQATSAAKPRVSRMTDSQVIPVPAQRTSGGSILEILAAAVLIFALVSSGFYMYRIQNGTTSTDPDGQRLAATTPLASPTPAPDRTNGVWTDPGHTNAFPAGFDPATAQPAEQLADLPFSSVYGRVVDDSLVVYGIPQDESTIEERGESVLSVIDLESGDERWSAPLAISGPFTADENTIYVQEMDVSANPVTVSLVALSVETGERLWTHEMQQFDDPDNSGVDIVSPFSPMSFGTPIAIDGNLYVARTNGDVLALDGATGDIIWESASETDVAPEDAIGGSLVGNDRHLYVVDSENAIIKLDRKTGDIVDRFAINHLPVSEFFLYLHLQDNRLVLIAQDAPPQPGSRVYINVFDTGTGDTIWNTDIDRITGNVVITDGVIGFASAPAVERATIEQSTEEPLEVRFLSLDTGNLEFEYFHDNAATVTLTAAGSTICIHDAGPSTPCVNADDPDRTLHPLNIGSPYTAEGPPSRILFWNNNAIVLGHEGGPHIIRSGAGSGVATPEISDMQRDAQSELLSNDPGHTSASPSGYDPVKTGEAVQLDTVRVSPNTSVIAGDNLIVSGRVEGTSAPEGTLEFATQAIDLSTGDELWFSGTGLFGTVVVDDSHVYGYQGDADFGRQSGNLVSLSLATGALEWTVQPETSAPNDTLLPTSDLMMIDTHLYVTFPNGSVAAYSQHGQVEWEFETEEPPPNTVRENWHPATADENFIYTAKSDGTITKLDRLTGETVETFNIETDQSNSPLMNLHVRDGVLVAIVHSPDDQESTPETIMAISTDSGELLWQHEVDYVSGNLLLTETMVGISQYVLGDPPTAQMVAFHDIETGKLLVETDAMFSSHPSLSASGDVTCIYTTTVECGSIGNLQKVVSGVAFPSSTWANPPIMFWNDQLVIANIETGVYVTRPNSTATPAAMTDASAQAVEAVESTPLATAEPVGTDQGTARGGGFGTTASLDPTYPDSALPTEPLAPAWKQEVSAPKWMMPYGGVIAVLGTSELAVYDENTGSELWTKPAGNVFADQLSPEAESSNFVLALNMYSFAMPWIAGDILYVTTQSELVGFDLMTGDEVFRANHHTNSGTGPQGASNRLPLNLAIDGSTAYVTSLPVRNQTSVSAIDLITGETLWTTTQGHVFISQMPVDDGYLVLAVKSDKDYLVALDATDGSVAWTVEDALLDDDPGQIDGTTFFATDGVLIESRMASQGQDAPSDDPANALGIAAYDMRTGEVLWTSRSDDPSWQVDPDALNRCGFFPRIHDDALVIPCWNAEMTSMHVVTLPLAGDGTAEVSSSLTGLPAASSASFVASDTTWIYGTDEEIVHLDLASGATTSMGVMGGETCDQRAFPTSNGLACLTTDGLGTYYLQVFGPESGETGTPDGTPQASPVAPQASIPGPTAISTLRGRRLTRFHAGTNSGRGACGAICDRDPGYSGPRSAALQPGAPWRYRHPRL